MHHSSPPPFSPLVMRIASLCIFIAITGFSFYAIKSGETGVYKYLILVLLLISVVGMKFAAHRLPWGQAALAGLAVFVVHIIIEHFSIPPMLYIGELIIQAICTIGFGRYWITKGYIPAFSNKWP